MSIQDQIDARFAELQQAVKQRLGEKFTIRYEFARICGVPKVGIWTYSDFLAHDIIGLCYSAPSIDAAFDAALAKVATMRTYADECADLGITPASQQAEAA